MQGAQMAATTGGGGAGLRFHGRAGTQVVGHPQTGHPDLAGDGPRAGHLGQAQKRTCGRSPMTWPQLDPDPVLEVLTTDHPDAETGSRSALRPGRSAATGIGYAGPGQSSCS